MQILSDYLISLIFSPFFAHPLSVFTHNIVVAQGGNKHLRTVIQEYYLSDPDVFHFSIRGMSPNMHPLTSCS